MKYIISLCIVIFLSLQQVSAVPQQLILNNNENSIISDGSSTLISLLSLIQSILLKWVLPVVTIGASIWIAYVLLTAEGDESKMKKAWKSIVYTAIALISIALSYGVVSIVSRLNIS